MKVKTLILAALAVQTAMVLAGASSAMAESTSLCTTDESPCAGANQIRNVHETSVGTMTLASSGPTIKCDALFSGDTDNGLGSPLIVIGSYTYTNCNNFCTVKEENGPAEFKVLRSGTELSQVIYRQLLLRVSCTLSLCYYDVIGVEGHGLGPLTSSQANGSIDIEAQELIFESGFGCPARSLTITTTPLVKTYISS